MIIGIHNWRIQLNQENKYAFKDMAFCKKCRKNICDKYGKKIRSTTTKSGMNAAKLVFKRVVEKVR